MNRTELTAEVSRLPGVSTADCDKVLEALEQVLNDKLASSKGIKSAFGKIHELMNLFANK